MYVPHKFGFGFNENASMSCTHFMEALIWHFQKIPNHYFTSLYKVTFYY